MIFCSFTAIVRQNIWSGLGKASMEDIASDSTNKPTGTKEDYRDLTLLHQIGSTIRKVLIKYLNN